MSMRTITSRTPTFCGLYTRSYPRYLALVRRVSGVWPEPVPVEVVDVRAMARRALECVVNWRPYENA